jgi:hypothetical protein
MGAGPNAQPQPKRRRVRAWMLAAVSLVLAVAIPAGMPQLRASEAIPARDAVLAALPWLWDASCVFLALYLAWAFLRLLRRGAGRLAARRKAQAELAPIAGLLSPPSFSPSRASAQRNLPDYARRLIKTA